MAKFLLGPILTKKGKKSPKCNFWPYYPNASFLLVGIWQGHLENDFEDNDQDFGYGKNFIGPKRGKNSPKMQHLAILSKCLISFGRNLARSSRK